jgi:hypothetical protein
MKLRSGQDPSKIVVVFPGYRSPKYQPSEKEKESGVFPMTALATTDVHLLLADLFRDRPQGEAFTTAYRRAEEGICALLPHGGNAAEEKDGMGLALSIIHSGQTPVIFCPGTVLALLRIAHTVFHAPQATIGGKPAPTLDRVYDCLSATNLTPML